MTPFIFSSDCYALINFKSTTILFLAQPILKESFPTEISEGDIALVTSPTLCINSEQASSQQVGRQWHTLQ